MDYVDIRPNSFQSALCGVLLTIGTVFAWLRYRRRGYPDGPFSLPVIGTLCSPRRLGDLLKTCHTKFGKVFTFYFGGTPIVLLSDYNVVHEAFVSQADDFSSRPTDFGSLFGGGEDKGIAYSPNWKEQRKFALTVLREQGMGKIDMEGKILEEVAAFLGVLEVNREAPLMLNSHIHKAVSNVICNLVLGSRFDYSDPEFTSLIDFLRYHTKHMTFVRFIRQWPLLTKLPWDIFGYHRFMNNARKNSEFFSAKIREHSKNLDMENPRDFIDAYLVEIDKRATAGSSSSFDVPNCLTAIIQLFVAGTDTTSTTLLWAWLYMLLYPDVQRKVQAEIDQQIGTRQPSTTDRLAMPYTEAVLTEVMRIANTSIMSLPHRAEREVLLDGHVIPKDTTVFASLIGIHMDENNYPEPNEFKPERFLSHSGEFQKPRKFLPFSIGRRACIGEALARAELFFFFTSVLQHFNLKAPGDSRLTAAGMLAFTYQPQPYKIQFIKREACTNI